MSNGLWGEDLTPGFFLSHECYPGYFKDYNVAAILAFVSNVRSGQIADVGDTEISGAGWVGLNGGESPHEILTKVLLLAGIYHNPKVPKLLSLLQSAFETTEVSAADIVFHWSPLIVFFALQRFNVNGIRHVGVRDFIVKQRDLLERETAARKARFVARENQKKELEASLQGSHRSTAGVADDG